MVLDLKSEDGKETVCRLAATADILVENFRPGVMQRLRLDYEALCADTTHGKRIAALGEHTRELCAEAGFGDDAQIPSGKTAAQQ